MNKEEKNIYSSSAIKIFSSTIAQYLNTSDNTTYLFYANKEKNFLYFKRLSRPINYVNIIIDGEGFGSLLPETATGTLFFDITEIIKSMSVDIIHTLQIYVSHGGESTSVTYNIVPMQGYNYDNLALTLSIAQDNFCNLKNLALCGYDQTSSSSIVSPPTKIIVPFENGLRKFGTIQNLYIPFYNNDYGGINVRIYQGSRTIASASFGSNISNLLSFNINNLQGLYSLQLRIVGTLINQLALEAFNPAKKYVAVKWAYPYTNTVYVGTQGAGAPSYSRTKSFATTFFELAEYEEEQEIIELEDTGGEMPYLVNSGRRCKLRMTNLNAYDYIYYAQILKSENVSILFDDNLLTSNYQPVKLEKSKITLPTNGTELYNLEFNVIISEND